MSQNSIEILFQYEKLLEFKINGLCSYHYNICNLNLSSEQKYRSSFVLLSNFEKNDIKEASFRFSYEWLAENGK